MVGRTRAPPGGRSSESQRRLRPHACSPRRLRTEGLLRHRKAAWSSRRLQFPVRPLRSAPDLSPRASGSWARVSASAIPGPSAPVQPGWPQGGWAPLRSLCLIRAGAGGCQGPCLSAVRFTGPHRSPERGISTLPLQSRALGPPHVGGRAPGQGRPGAPGTTLASHPPRRFLGDPLSIPRPLQQPLAPFLPVGGGVLSYPSRPHPGRRLYT